ncbi:MAG: hypothetical protein HYX27_06320 [Acidobacteria bacterium]|nr:hypothetical protein [Acidobacteriota bacterium]
MEIDKFVRCGTRHTLRIPKGSDESLLLGSGFYKFASIEKIEPAPVRSRISAAVHELMFQSTTLVLIHYIVKDYGCFHWKLGIGGHELDVSTIALP